MANTQCELEETANLNVLNNCIYNIYKCLQVGINFKLLKS